RYHDRERAKSKRRHRHFVIRLHAFLLLPRPNLCSVGHLLGASVRTNAAKYGSNRERGHRDHRRTTLVLISTVRQTPAVDRPPSLLQDFGVFLEDFFFF